MKRALLVIDVQNEYFTGQVTITYPTGSLNNVSRAIKAAHTNNIPIIAIQHTAQQENSKTFRKGTAEWKLHPQIAGEEYDLLMEKSLPGSFTGTGLEAWLRENSIDMLVIAGYMTQMCCDTTARQAVHLGFAVEFLSDATGTLEISNYAGTVSAEELHRAILVTQATRFSKVLTTEEWIKSILD